METTSQAGRIHISYGNTARLIRETGKEQWLIQRNGGVVATGKGNLHTLLATDGRGFHTAEWVDRKEDCRTAENCRDD